MQEMLDPEIEGGLAIAGTLFSHPKTSNGKWNNY